MTARADSRVVVVNSHGGGTGKSTVAVTLAECLVARGRSVCLVDTDVQTPGLHVLLGLGEDDVARSLADHLLGGCSLEDTAHDVTVRLGLGPGRLLLVPGKLDAPLIARIVGQGYDAGVLDEAFRTIATEWRPDVVVIDTHAGMSNETMVALAAADDVVLLTRPDEQDFRGAAVTESVTRLLNCPRVSVLVNMVAAGQDGAVVLSRTRAAYGCEVVAAIPYRPELAARRRQPRGSVLATVVSALSERLLGA